MFCSPRAALRLQGVIHIKRLNGVSVATMKCFLCIVCVFIFEMIVCIINTHMVLLVIREKSSGTDCKGIKGKEIR